MGFGNCGGREIPDVWRERQNNFGGGVYCLRGVRAARDACGGPHPTPLLGCMQKWPCRGMTVCCTSRVEMETFCLENGGGGCCAELDKVIASVWEAGGGGGGRGWGRGKIYIFLHAFTIL